MRDVRVSKIMLFEKKPVSLSERLITLSRTKTPQASTQIFRRLPSFFSANARNDGQRQTTVSAPNHSQSPLRSSTSSAAIDCISGGSHYQILSELSQAVINACLCHLIPTLPRRSLETTQQANVRQPSSWKNHCQLFWSNLSHKELWAEAQIAEKNTAVRAYTHTTRSEPQKAKYSKKNRLQHDHDDRLPMLDCPIRRHPTNHSRDR